MKIPGVPGYQNPPQPKSVTIVTPRNDYDDCHDVEDSMETTRTSARHDNIYSVIDESPSPPSILSPQATLSSGSSDSMGLLGEIVNEIESRGSDSVYIATTLKRDGGTVRKNSQAPKAEEEEDDDEPTYVNTSEIQEDDDDPTEDDEPYPANLKSSVSTTSSGYLRPSAINAPIARVAPSKPESVSSNLSSFKNGGGGNVLSTLKFEGPTSSESSKPPAAVAKKSTAPAPYKPYHSTVANSRPGSVVTATKSKISQDKQQLANGAAPKLSRTTTPPNITTNGRKPLGNSVRTRSPSPKGRIANGGVTAAKAAAPQKPKTPAKPESVVKPKISSASSSSASSKILTAAARPAPGKPSNVASLQQKFETKK